MPTKIALLFFVVCRSLMSADFCAAKVLLTNQFGKPATALVQLRDNSGNVVQQRMARQGVAEFCDFGFGEHSFEIAGSSCSAIVVPHVKLRFGVEQVFRVYLNPCTVGENLFPRNCVYYFRVGSADQKLSGVTITSQPAGVSATTDSFGRAEIWVRKGERKLVEFAKVGYVTYHLDVACESPGYNEREVVLVSADQSGGKR
jgi:hypothetical protein